MQGPWEFSETPLFYEAFCEKHDRYRSANSVLIRKGRLSASVSRVLDVGAGTGRTAEAALGRLGPEARVVCVEPSAAMRRAGKSRLIDSRIRWRTALPVRPASFDRILCGAAIWQMSPLAETLRRFAGLLREGGALCFNIPGLYLQEADAPGGGDDPHLLALPARVFRGRADGAISAYEPLTARLVEDALRAVGLRATAWSHRIRLKQEAYAAWLKIPVLTEHCWSGLSPQERARRIDGALGRVDRASWRWETWKGWTAWKLG